LPWWSFSKIILDMMRAVNAPATGVLMMVSAPRSPAGSSSG